MIQDFLEVNKLDGKIISFPSDTTIEKAVESTHLSAGSVAKVAVFFDEKMDFFIVIAPKDHVVLVKEANELFKKKTLEVAGEEETKNLSGFEKKFFPPISVFGTTVAMHPILKNKPKLVFALGYREFLVITPKAIMDAAEVCDAFEE
ncbi:MAG: YbaK/EbsC family protein [archaeon]|jgi:prolyl-tRNA editing enzyme YbaK/EbsC (Cys-tRNA(Pro) deacylase)